MSLEFETKLRDLMFDFWSVPHPPRSMESSTARANLMLGTPRLCWDAATPTKALGQEENGNGNCFAFPASGAGLFDRLQWIQVRSQLTPRNSRNALDLQHTKWGNFIPLCDGLLSDVQRSGELGEAAGGFDGAIEGCL